MDYPWFELIENSSEITQGDILRSCPVPILKEVNFDDNATNVDAEVVYVDGIILTQACDIANNKVESIIVCAVTSRGDFNKTLKEAGKGDKEINNQLTGIIKGQQHAYHIINSYTSDVFSQDYFIVNFKEIYSVPVDVARTIAKQNGKRLRLCPPYREHLSQAFARYFMRVGLPINIVLD